MKSYTIREIAKICKVTPRTVSKWFESGRIRGYGIPGTRDWSATRENLIRFLKQHGMPLGELDSDLDETPSEKLVNATPQILIDTLMALPEDVRNMPIGVHSMGNGVDVRVNPEGVQLVGFNSGD